MSRYSTPGRFREHRTVLVLGMLAALVVVGVALAPRFTPFSSLMIALLLGSIVLNPRQLPWFVVWVLGMLTIALTLQETITIRTAGAAAV